MNLDRLCNAAHSLNTTEALQESQSNLTGLNSTEALKRLIELGKNKLPEHKTTGPFKVFLRQFRSPFIYVLLLATILSLILEHYSDAGFILGILLLNAVIGTTQEYGAEKSAKALRELTAHKSLVLRDNTYIYIDSTELVIGDILLVESGTKIAADARLIECNDLSVDESLLTGESFYISKNCEVIFPKETVLGDRKNMIYAGTIVARGRAKALITATGVNSQLGVIANNLSKDNSIKTPLLLRMEGFTKRLTLILAFVVLFIGIYLILQGNNLTEVLVLAVAMGVGAIPEGLPVAITIALSLGARRMSKRNVIIRRLAAVESLGSCTYIGTDKTGTLTENNLTAQAWASAFGEVFFDDNSAAPPNVFENICLASLLANESKDIDHKLSGDPVDVAIRVSVRKNFKNLDENLDRFALIRRTPYESEIGFCAAIHETGNDYYLSVKGAPEKFSSLHRQPKIRESIQELAAKGYRVLAIGAEKTNTLASIVDKDPLSVEIIGLVGLIDPPRNDAKEAIKQSQDAGIQVSMITGDHPTTSLAIAKALGLASNFSQVLTGAQLKGAKNNEAIDQLVKTHKVFARVEPEQKLVIANSLMRQGHFLAITGDGANDAPALKAANVGVAMGKSGTDVAKECSELIITDDRFSSIIAGIEEGRVAYSNIRKVVYLLISTGASEIILFILCVFTGIPMPLTAVQILWLNLVTNGIQDVALAFEPKEGDELTRPPRHPREKIFNALMIQRVLLSATIVAIGAYLVFSDLLKSGMSLESAQNHILLLMVLFENIMVGNARSEISSGLKNIFRNPFLVYGTLAAQGIHILAMHYEPIAKLLSVEPVSFETWSKYLLIAVSVFITIEIHKWWHKRHSKKTINKI